MRVYSRVSPARQGHRPVTSVRWSRVRSCGFGGHRTLGRLPARTIPDTTVGRGSEPLTGQGATPGTRKVAGSRKNRGGAPRGARDPITRGPHGSASHPLPPAGLTARHRSAITSGLHRLGAPLPFGSRPPRELRALSRRGQQSRVLSQNPANIRMNCMWNTAAAVFTSF
jgi:hypothetical protein